MRGVVCEFWSRDFSVSGILLYKPRDAGSAETHFRGPEIDLMACRDFDD